MAKRKKTQEGDLSSETEETEDMIQETTQEPVKEETEVASSKKEAPVFTEYPKQNDFIVNIADSVKEKQAKTESAPANDDKNLTAIEAMAVKLKEAMTKEGTGLEVVLTKQFGDTIRIVGNNGLHCYSRVRQPKEGQFVGEFLAFIPAKYLKPISAIYKKLGIGNKNGTYLSTAGLT
jgi:hypothetical protein